MTTAIASTATRCFPTQPPTPAALVQQFADSLSQFPRGRMAPSGNPAYVALLARDQVQAIDAILTQAAASAKHGDPAAKQLARSYRAIYSLFGAIADLGDARNYKAMQSVLQLGFFAGLDEPSLRDLCAGGVDGRIPQDQLSADALRSYLVHQQINAQPDLQYALQSASHDFDKQMIKLNLNSFVDTIRHSSGYSAQKFINDAQSTVAAYLGLGAAGSLLGWLSPEAVIAGTLAGTAMSSCHLLVQQVPNLTRDQVSQLASGMGELTRIVEDLETAQREADAAEQPTRKR